MALSVRPSVIILEEGKLLVVRSVYGGEEFYLLPGGGIEGTETLYEAGVRETREETGQDVRILKVAYLNDFIEEASRCLNVYLLGKRSGQKPLTPQSDEGNVKEALWISLKELENLDFRPKELIRRIQEDHPDFSSEDIYFVG